MNRFATKRFVSLCVLTALSILLFAACTRSQSKGVVSSQFIPPTLVATAFKTPTTDPFQPTANPRGPCTDDLTFIDDLTVPDGSVFAPGEQIVKQWQVENSGTCEWTSKYSVRILSGSSMGAAGKQKLPSIPPGEEGMVEVIFTAPEEIGNYYCQLQAYDDSGKPFGHDFFIDIIVSSISAN